MIDKFVVVGIGLIGGSLAAALKRCGACREVIGVARRQETCDEALALSLVDRAVTSIEDIAAELGESDLVFVAVPTLAVERTLQTIKDTVSPEVCITDGASVKGSVVRAALKVWGYVPPQLVPGHPIAGSEKSGASAAKADLYDDHRVILTPLPETSEAHLSTVRDMWISAGAEVLEMPVNEHDDVLAATSHLPHVIAYSLVDTLAHDAENENIFRYAAGGFRDFTRIASSDPVMWHDIMKANKKSVLGALDLFTQNLGRLRESIEKEDGEHMLGVFTRAKSARDRFTKMLAKQAYADGSGEARNINFVVSAGGRVSGDIRVPGDKSISHRAVILGSIAEGTTEVKGLLEGEDVLATLQAMRDMGVVVEGPDRGVVRIHGVGLKGLKPAAGPLYLGNSGTSMRLLAGLLSGLPFTSELIGDDSLSRRPMARIIKPLNMMGASIESVAGGLPPLVVKGTDSLRSLDYDMPEPSAQVKSSILLAGLNAQGHTAVTEPAPTRDHTERMLQCFDCVVERQGERVSLNGGGRLLAGEIEVPADISSAAFFIVAACIAPGSDITLRHVGVNPTRIGIIHILRMMGANIVLSNERLVGAEPVADIRVVYSQLRGIEIPAEQVPLAIDEFPVILVAAACAEGESRLQGAKELRFKESDRIQAMALGLQALGIELIAQPDGICITGGQLLGGSVDSCGDHRIAMAFVVAGLRASGSVRISNCANVASSFPGFVDLAQQSGIAVTAEEYE